MASISQIVKKYVLAPFGNLNSSLVNNIPLNTSNRQNGATWNYGFPQITMTPVGSGGKPPSGMDFNGIFNVLSNVLYNSQLGINANEFNPDNSYPMGAIVVYPPDGSTQKSFYISLQDNNETTPTQSNTWRDLLAYPNCAKFPDWSKITTWIDRATWNTTNVLTLAEDCWVEIYSDRNGKWTLNIQTPDGTYAYDQNFGKDDFSYFIFPMKAGTILYPNLNVGYTTIRLIGM
jgi:hypothetical protein